MTIWELDFYSRPLVDDKGKKRWEVLICESPLTVDRELDDLFRYQAFCQSTEVNSLWLRQQLQAAIAQAPAPPSRIRFFRRQMTNMIVKACDEAGLTASPSRRTPALVQWLEERLATTYSDMPGYTPDASTSVAYPPPVPAPLPDALRGQSWSLLSLAAEALQEMPAWEVAFGEAFPLGLTALAPETPVPGLVIFSPRATALGAWMSGLELGFLSVEPTQVGALGLLLHTGASDAWILANLGTTAVRQDAEAFETAKQAADNVHFLAVQSAPEAQAFAGFWLLQERNLA
ncbi:MAG: Tab2/Atab2 family RNA-binding protein [Cyanobacteria bacterium P01_A01_bin.135]